MRTGSRQVNKVVERQTETKIGGIRTRRNGGEREKKKGSLKIKRKGIENKVGVTGNGEGVRSRPKSKSKYYLELKKRGNYNNKAT